MKKNIFFLLLALNTLIIIKPIMAEDSIMDENSRIELKGYKDECLLLAINCGSDFLTLEQKIDKLENEISKGRSVYSDDELRILREQLDNANKTLVFFKNEGAGNRYKFPGE